MPLTITSTTTEFVTLDEVKAHLNVTGANNDSEIDLVSKAAQELVEGIVGPVRWRSVEQSAPVGSTLAVLSVAPVVSVTSVSYSGVTYLEPVTLDLDAGVLTGLTGGSDGTIVYVAGRAQCPDAIRLAALIIAGHLWRTQLGSAPSGALPVDDESQQPPGLGFAIPSRALDLLAPYMLPGGFA